MIIDYLFIKTGLPIDTLKTLLIIFLHFFISIFLKKLKNIQLRYFITSFIGFSSYYYLFGYSFLLYLLTSIPFYYIIKNYYNNRFKIYILCFIVLTSYQIYKVIVSYGSWKIDLSSFLMVYVPKLTFYLWYINDQKAKEDFKDNDSFLLFFNYILSYLGCLGTPLYDYKEYIDFINLENNFKEIEESSTKEGIKALFLGLLLSVLNIIGYKLVPLNTISLDSYKESNFIYRIFKMNISSLFMRFKYYGAFLLLQSSVIMSGLGNNKIINSLDIINIENNGSPQKRIGSWNISISRWLRLTVYNRTNTIIGKQRSKLLVFLFSAFWHGVYPNYYMTFLMCFYLIKTENYIYVNKGLFSEKSYKYFNFMFLFFCYNIQNMSGLIFCNLNRTDLLNIVKNNYFLILSPILVDLMVTKYIKYWKIKKIKNK